MPPIVLDESQSWPAAAIPAAALIAALPLALFLADIFWYAVIGFVAALAMAVFRRRNAILADDEGLLLREKGRVTRSWRWTEIDRIGWAAHGYWGARLVVHPSGGPYDVPGPNSPVRVGHVWNPRRDPAADPLPGLRERHGLRPLPEE